MIKSDVTTITLDGNEAAVEFSTEYPYFWVTNKGGADIYVSRRRGVVPEADGVYTVPAGGSERIGNGSRFGTLYLLGSGKVQVRGEQIAAQPSFNRGGKGGESDDILNGNVFVHCDAVIEEVFTVERIE